ncbi:MAG: hypothetical protein LBG72_08080 [Spirochaetaceae bacterium]|jgi:hypothetical protein|nr:hypothetical protein [Spirochaetaceae bacterium]
MSGFIDKMKSALNEGWEASKDLAVKAGSKAQELGEKGVITVEIKKLEFDIERQIKKLGLEVYQLFAENGRDSVAASESAIAAILNEISELKSRIEAKQASLKLP